MEELFTRHHQHLFNYGLNIVSNREIVNDAIQQVFLTLWKKHSQLSEAQSVKAYLLTSVRRSIFEQLERNTNRKERGKNYLEKRSEHTFSIEHKLVQDEISQELSERLEAAIKELTPRQKEAVYLRFYNGLTNNEIAVIMDISYQAVGNLLYNAISRLRASMDYRSLAG
ncbi:sigma-70 family RNA polymerase sigma factor [Aliifodinibius sp. S!AR15-10]|nr:sigma-70 family RNA polymerase sigma factor [Aliifodinibius sp. S!AR15-10]